MANIEITKRHTFTGHSGAVYDLKALNDHQFLSSSGDGQIARWDTKTLEDGVVIGKVQSTVYTHEIDQDRLLVGENGYAIHLIDIKSKKPIRSIEIKPSIFVIKRIDDAYFVGTRSGELFIFDLDLNLLKKVQHSNDSLRSISVNPTDIALAYTDNIIRILDRKTLELKYGLTSHTNTVFCVEYHPITNQLVSTGRDATIRVWDTFNHYEEIHNIPAHMGAVHRLTFRGSGDYLASASMDKTIKIWDTTNFALLKVIDKARHDGHINSVNGLLWMEYDNLLVTCSDDRSIAVWDIKFD